MYTCTLFSSDVQDEHASKEYDTVLCEFNFNIFISILVRFYLKLLLGDKKIIVKEKIIHCSFPVVCDFFKCLSYSFAYVFKHNIFPFVSCMIVFVHL